MSTAESRTAGSPQDPGWPWCRITGPHPDRGTNLFLEAGDYGGAIATVHQHVSAEEQLEIARLFAAAYGEWRASKARRSA